MKQLILQTVTCICLLGLIACQKTVKNEPTTFDIQQEFEIQALKVTNDYPSSITLEGICEGWNLKEEEAVSILKQSRAIDGVEWHHLFDHLPCQIEGQIIQNDNNYDFAINGGAWMSISLADTTLFYGSFDPINNKYFLSTVMTEEDMH